MGAAPGERLGAPHPAARALAAAPCAAGCIPKASPPASAPRLSSASSAATALRPCPSCPGFAPPCRLRLSSGLSFLKFRFDDGVFSAYGASRASRTSLPSRFSSCATRAFRRRFSSLTASFPIRSFRFSSRMSWYQRACPTQSSPRSDSTSLTPSSASRASSRLQFSVALRISASSPLRTCRHLPLPPTRHVKMSAGCLSPDAHAGHVLRLHGLRTRDTVPRATGHSAAAPRD